MYILQVVTLVTNLFSNATGNFYSIQYFYLFIFFYNKFTNTLQLHVQYLKIFILFLNSKFKIQHFSLSINIITNAY